MKNLAKLAACVLSVFMLMSSVVFAAGDVSLVKKRAYNANNGDAVRLASSVKGVEFEVKNDSSSGKTFSLIVAKYSGDLCKEVLIADAVNADAGKSEKIRADIGSISGVDTLKCIVVESFENG